jgi:predicted MFS family arabinose efflux permease
VVSWPVDFNGFRLRPLSSGGIHRIGSHRGQSRGRELRNRLGESSESCERDGPLKATPPLVTGTGTTSHPVGDSDSGAPSLAGPDSRSETGLIRNPNFLRLYFASVASSGGAAVAIVSISWLVYTSTGSAIAITYVGLAGVAPGVVLALIAGVVADRYNRRRVMVISDLSRTGVISVLALTLYFSGFHLVAILGAVVVLNVFTVLFRPASSAILPRIVGPGTLEAANGLLQGSNQASQMLGAAAGGAAIAFAGVVPNLAFNALTYIVSAMLLLQIASTFGKTTSPDEVRPGARSVRSDIAEGLAYMRTHKAILEVTLGFLPGNLFWTMMVNFTVVYAASYYSGSPVAYGYLVAAVGGGYVVGAVCVARLRLRRYAGLTLALTVAFQGASGVGLALSHNYPLSIGLAACLGAGAGLVNTVYFATMQALVPNRVLGRVLSVDSVGAYTGIPAGLLLGGVLITSFGIGTDYLLAGVAMTANGIFMLSLRDLRQLRFLS